MNKKLQTLKYVIADSIAAASAWALFFIFRKEYIEPEKYGYDIGLHFDSQFYIALMLIPIFWLLLYWSAGAYREPYRHTRLRDIIRTFNTSLFGVLVLFFALLLDDEVSSYKTYYKTAGTLFLLQFILTVTGRLMLTTQTVKLVRRRRIGFNTLIIGSQQKALSLYNELEGEKLSQGYFFRGYIQANESDNTAMGGILPYLGNMENITNIIKQKNIAEIIIAIETSEHFLLNKILNQLDDEDVVIKILPDMYDILTGSVKMSHLFGAPLIEVSREIMPPWQVVVKRQMDMAVSLVILLLFSPLYIILAIMVKLDSKGPIFYKQERIGRGNKPFYIYKYRTMKVGAENGKPQLSSTSDDRRTRIGKHLRKYRMDEMPQFWNVLIGEMSLVGPRPERQFFIDQILQKAPHYNHLLKVRPGITSWGQVKYGYAENVDQMVERLKYDTIYIENMSLALDFRIMFYTIVVVFGGRGK